MATTSELKTFQKRLGYRFRDRSLLVAALTHPSYRHEGDNEGDEDNQRLEFLGDAVLGLITAETLYDHPGKLDEGRMTQLRSMTTNRQALAAIGRDWNIGLLLRMGRGERGSGGAGRESNLADAVEAILGAILQDGGPKACRKVFARHFTPRLLELVPEGRNPLLLDNPKGALQEITQRIWQDNPTYSILDEKGPAHDRVYVAAVLWQGEEIGRGQASGKRAAEAKAAEAALPEIQRRAALTSSSDGTSS